MTARVKRLFSRGSSALACVLVAVVLGAAAPALAAGDSYHPMRFEHITLDDGLSQSTVLTVLQDSKGLLWIGTENGLNRYDGYDIETFKRERGNPDALSSDFIFDIEEDADSNLWIATNGGGLVKYDRVSGKFRAYRHDPEKSGTISSNVARRILIDADGMVWIGTRGAGLDRLNPATGTIRCQQRPRA